MSICLRPFGLLTAAVLAIPGIVAGCGDVTPSGSVDSVPPTTGEALPSNVSGDVPGAPLRFDYRIVGNPVAGRPVAVELIIETDLNDRPIILNYQEAEAGSLTFPESQAKEIEVVAIDGADLRPVQVTVVPARDGRVYLSIMATVETGTGSVRKAMAIPIMVSPAPLEESSGENV